MRVFWKGENKAFSRSGGGGRRTGGRASVGEVWMGVIGRGGGALNGRGGREMD